MKNFTIVTLFPDMFPGPLGHSVMGQAIRKYWQMDIIDMRDFSDNKHRRVDDRPFGGGAGMVIRAEVVYQSLQAAINKHHPQSPLIVHLTPRGEKLTTAMARDLARHDDIIFLCGHYEGIDQRFFDHHQQQHPTMPIKEISIGDYVLSGGELPAMVVMESLLRHVAGVLGKEASLTEESHEGGLLEYHHYTRPEEWRGLKPPSMLLTGHHKKIKEFREAQSLTITKERRPDLLGAGGKIGDGDKKSDGAKKIKKQMKK